MVLLHFMFHFVTHFISICYNRQVFLKVELAGIVCRLYFFIVSKTKIENAGNDYGKRNTAIFTFYENNGFWDIVTRFAYFVPLFLWANNI